MKSIIPADHVESLIYTVHGHRVILDRDLARLYGVETSNLNKAAKRNKARFPADFMFQLSAEETSRFQIGILKRGQNIKYRPHVFTEQGVAMLSGVLHSPRAIQVNVAIMRTFVRLRMMLATNKELARRLDALEKKYDSKFRIVFDAIRELMTPPEEPHKQIGFKPSK